MTGVRGHEAACPVARETWCVWPGDKCDWCSAYLRGRADTLTEIRAHVEARNGYDFTTNALGRLRVRNVTPEHPCRYLFIGDLRDLLDAALAADEHQQELDFASLHEEGLA